MPEKVVCVELIIMATKKTTSKKTTTKPKAKKPAAKKKATHKREHICDELCEHAGAFAAAKVAIPEPVIEPRKKKNIWERIFRFGL